MIQLYYHITCDNSPITCFSKIEFITKGKISIEKIKKEAKGWTIKNDGTCYCPACGPYGKKLKLIKKNKKTKIINRNKENNHVKD